MADGTQKALIENKSIARFDWHLSDVAELDPQTKVDELTFEKQLIYSGKHHMGDKGFTIDETDIDHWVDVNAKMMADGVETPVTSVDAFNRHNKDPERTRAKVIGYRKGPDSKGRPSLFARMKFRDKEAAKMTETTQVSLSSPAMIKRGGKQYPRGIDHIALTDYPCVLGLDGFTKLHLSEPLLLADDMKERDKAFESDKMDKDGDKGPTIKDELMRLAKSGVGPRGIIKALERANDPAVLKAIAAIPSPPNRFRGDDYDSIDRAAMALAESNDGKAYLERDGDAVLVLAEATEKTFQEVVA